MITRRGFLKRLGMGAGALAAAQIAPLIPSKDETPALVSKQIETIKVLTHSYVGDFVPGEVILAGQLVMLGADGQVYAYRAPDPGMPIGICVDKGMVLKTGVIR